MPKTKRAPNRAGLSSRPARSSHAPNMAPSPMKHPASSTDDSRYQLEPRGPNDRPHRQSISIRASDRSCANECTGRPESG